MELYGLEFNYLNMKKTILTLLLLTGIAFAQEKPKEAPLKQDTTISVKMNINQFRALLYTIDQNIDSKKVSKELLEFLQKSAQIVQPADKPKINKP
jgi:hypothetical protein